MSRLQRKFEAHVLRNHKREALKEQQGVCRYCLAPLTVAKATADHIKPRVNGGTNARANIVACCAPCNTAKGSMNVLTFTRAIKNPSGASIAVHLAWSRRRVWLATYRACRGIRYAAGLGNDTPVGLRTAA